MTQPLEQPRTAAGRALLTILRHRAQVATTEPCMAALIGAVDDAVRMLPKIEAEAAAPDPVASPRRWKWLYDDYDKGTVFITDDPENEQRPLFAQSFDERTARLIVDAHNSAVASPTPLDVERLARALHATRGTGPPIDWDDPNCDCPEDARAIAAAYALTGQPVAEEPA